MDGSSIEQLSLLVFNRLVRKSIPSRTVINRLREGIFLPLANIRKYYSYLRIDMRYFYEFSLYPS